MKDLRRASGFARELVLATGLLLATGCTLYDEYAPGEPFTPDQPKGAVTVVGTVNSDRIAVASAGCVPGNTIFWGQASNTGDMEVTNVSISVTAFDAGGGALGSWSGPVYNGDVETIEPDPDNPAAAPIDVAGTTLVVDQTGTFTVCSSAPFGTVARTEYHTSFTEVEGTTQ